MNYYDLNGGIPVKHLIYSAFYFYNTIAGSSREASRPGKDGAKDRA